MRVAQGSKSDPCFDSIVLQEYKGTKRRRKGEKRKGWKEECVEERQGRNERSNEKSEVGKREERNEQRRKEGKEGEGGWEGRKDQGRKYKFCRRKEVSIMMLEGP